MTRRTIVGTGIRVAAGVVTLAVGAAVVLGATALPLPTLAQTPAGRQVTPVALDQQRVCSGSLLQLAGDSGTDATRVTSTGKATTVSGASTGVTPRTSDLSSADGSSASPLLVTAPVSGSGSGTRIPLLAAAQSQSVSSSDLDGLAVSSCAEPSSSSWLVGGSTETGRTTLIDLVNPTDVNSTVDLSLAGENGVVDGPGLTGIVVAPRSQKVVPMSGFASGLASPVVHVTSRGGQISASLQESVVRTLEPGGVDVIGAAAAPSTTTVVPGIVVRDGAAIETQLGTPGYSDLKSVMRVYVPGRKDADLSIAVGTASGTGTTFTVTATAGKVTDVPLDGLADGLYSATIRSSEPVVAGARTSSIGAAGSDETSGAVDLAWTGAAPALSGKTLVAVANAPQPQLTLVNPSSKNTTVDVTPRAGDGTAASGTSVIVPANGTVTTDLTGGDTVTLSGADGLRAAVSYQASGQIAAYPVVSPAAESAPVTVYP